MTQSNKDSKKYLLDLLATCFNYDMYQEAKLNLNELHLFFDDLAPSYRTLLDLIGKYDSDVVSKVIITEALSDIGISGDEAINITNRVTEARKLSPEELELRRARIKDACIQAAMNKAKRIAGDNFEKYQKLVNNYQYIDLGVNRFVIKDIGDLDVTTLTEKYLADPIPSKFDWINKAFAGKNGYLRGSLGIVCGRPKSGKSMFLMQEAITQARLGYKVLYLALGDLNELDFIVRMAAIDTETSIDIVYSDVKTYRDKMMAHLKTKGGSVSISVFAAGVLTPEELLTVSKNRLKDEFDTIMIDYDLNFCIDNESQYERGGFLYDLLSQVKVITNALILVATQPNKTFWNDGLLDDTCFIESSKKSMIADFAITIGKEAESGTHCGYVNIPINRRGGNPCRPYIMANTGELITVPESVYATLSGDPTRRSHSIKELTMLVNLASA